jgi:hypothetical protein
LDGYIDSISVKCSYLNLSDIPLLRPDSVQNLDLSHNVIRTLRNDSFPNYLRLSTVILSYNGLEDIQLNAFPGLQMIRTIDLSHNNLKSIYPEIFSSNQKLQFLFLSSNPLTHIPSQSPILVSDSVVRLDLSSCSLTKIDSLTFCRLPRLYNLDLSSNFLQTVSVSSLENLPHLNVLRLANNRWTCNCEVVELVQWESKRRGRRSAHRPIKCLEGGKYRTLWSAAGGGRSCNESTTPAPLVVSATSASLAANETADDTAASLEANETADDTAASLASSEAAVSSAVSFALSETTADTAVSLAASETTTNIAATLTRLPFSPKIAPYSPLHPAEETAVTGGDEPTATPEIETGDSDGLFSWNTNTILVFLILPCTLGVAIFLALMAANYCTKRRKIHHPRHAIQGEDERLDPQLTADIAKQYAGYININSQGIPYDTYHIYEEID